MNLKKALALAVAASLIFVCSCQSGAAKNGIKLIEDKSRFDDFTVIGDKVYMDCQLTIENQSDEDVTVKINASSQEDELGGLLKAAGMSGLDEQLMHDTFVLPSGENSIAVVFEGEFGGKEQKKDKLLPDEIQFEEVS